MNSDATGPIKVKIETLYGVVVEENTQLKEENAKLVAALEVARGAIDEVLIYAPTFISHRCLGCDEWDDNGEHADDCFNKVCIEAKASIDAILGKGGEGEK